MFRRGSLAIVMILALAACGREVDGIMAPPPGKVVGQQLGIPDHYKGAHDQVFVDAIVAMGKAQAAAPRGAFVWRVFSRGSSGKKPATALAAGGGEWEGTAVFRAAYKPTATYRLAQLEGTTGLGQVGRKVLLQPGGARVRYPGIWSLTTFARPLNHIDLADFRGHPLADLTPAATVARLSGSATGRLVGETRVDAEPLDLFEIARTPTMDGLVSREVVGLAKNGRRLRLHAMYAGDQKVFEGLVLSAKDEPGMSEAAFAI